MVFLMSMTALPVWQMVVVTLGLGVFFTAQTVLMSLAARGTIDLEWDVLQELLYWLIWALLAPLIRRSITRWPLEMHPHRRTLVLHAVVAISLAALQTSLAFGLHLAALQLVQPMAETEIVAWIARVGPSLIWGTFMGTLLYAVLAGVDNAIRVRRLYAHTQLDALRAQLRPHFLFNTLNAVSVLTLDDPTKARQMLLRFSALLRRAVDSDDREVTLREELAYLDEYLEIQRVRFGPRLEVTTVVETAAAESRVPAFFLQPLMENAMEHAVASREQRTVVTLRARRIGDVLHVSIEDNGPGPLNEASVREGIGLRNTREMLAQLYGRASSVTLRGVGPPPYAGACTEVTIPVSAGRR